MIALIKALVPGILLSWVVSTVIGASGSTGGILSIHRFVFHQQHMGWSWPLFFAGTFLAWALFMMTE